MMPNTAFETGAATAWRRLCELIYFKGVRLDTFLNIVPGAFNWLKTSSIFEWAPRITPRPGVGHAAIKV